MRLIICCLFLLLLSDNGFAQYICCKDTLRVPDPNYQCNMELYEPVCGCDLITYRNRCAAEYWGGLINNGFCLGWTEGTVCGNFDFDLIPTMVTYFPVKFSLFMKSPGSASLYIYDRNGALMFSDFFNAKYSGQILQREFNLQSLQIGIYIALVVVNGEIQSRKFGKVMDTLH